MGNVNELNLLLKNAEAHINNLLNKENIPPGEFPSTQGVYLIKNKKGEIIYIGKAKNLRRRILSDHISGELKISTSTFRRKINKVHKINSGKEMREWIKHNCEFVYEEIKDPDMCSLVEILLINLFRDTGKLLND